MKRIRLQAQVLLWQEPGSAVLGAEARQHDIIKMCVPCLESLTIQELADKIVEQWARVYVGYGSLDIKELQTVYGEPLDMEETVDAYFDDRKDPDNRTSSSEPPSTSIVRVIRFPPHPRELRNIVRFGSLMPESTARPRKRTYTNSIQNTRSSLHAVASIEERDEELPNKILTPPNKRQRIHEARAHEASRYERPVSTQAHRDESIYITSQTTGTQGSIHQVYDSQGSPAGKASNPYGTPTSLSLVNSQEPIPRPQVDITSIPDSPTSRRATSVDESSSRTTNLDRQHTKSESPEIRLSVHDVPNLEAPDTVKRTHTAILPSGLWEAPHGPISATRSRSTNLRENHVSETSDSGVQQRNQDTVNDVHYPLTLQERLTKSAWGEVHQPSEIAQGNIYDIENVTESFCERRQMPSAKRLGSGPTATERLTSPRRSSNGRSEKQLLISPITETREEGAGIPLSELAGPNNKVNGRTPANGVECTKSKDIEERQETPSLEPFNQLGVEASSCARSNSKLRQKEEVTANGKLLEEKEPPSQDATFSPQVTDLSAKNWSHLDVEHPLKQALSQGRRPDFSILPIIKDHVDSESAHDGLQAEEEERLQKGAEEQKENERAEQRRTDRDAKAKYDEQERRRLSEQRAEGCKADGTRLAEDTKAKEEKARLEQLSDAERRLAATKGKEEEASGAKAVTQSQASGKRGSVKNRNHEKMAREQSSKEKALAEEAEKTRLRQDGADQLKFEELHKPKTPAPSATKRAAAKTPGSRGYMPRTEEQKEKRRRSAAAKRPTGEEAQAAGTTRTQNWAQSLFQPAGWTRYTSEHIDTDTEEKKPLKKKVTAKSSSKDGQKLMNADRPSSPPAPSSTGAQGRKSMPSVLPTFTATNSFSIQNSLTSSSPLASRSSAHLDTPLRSALRHNQTPSELRRSVSFVQDRGNSTRSIAVPSDSSAVKPYVSIALPTKTLVDINNELALPTPAASKASPKAPVEDASNSETAKENLGKKVMVQQRLDVTRDTKLEGRADENRVSPRPAPKEETVVSSGDSDSDSASSLEDDMGQGQAKAGPSSRKRPSRVLLQQESVPRFNLRGTPIDPVIESLGSTTSGSASPLLPSRSNTTSNASSQPKSVSRSPAQAISETISVSSSSASGSQSESETGSGPDSDTESVEKLEPLPVRMSSSTGSSQRTATKRDVTTKVARFEIKPPGRGGHNDQSSRQAKDSSISVDAKNAADEAACQQLQLECSQPMAAQIAKPVPSAGDGIVPHDKLLNQGLNRDGRLPDGTRPAYFTYPKLSTLRKLQETKTPGEAASALSASQRFAVLPPRDTEPSDSSSDESSSNSDEDEDEDKDEDEDEDEGKIGQASPSGSPSSSKLKPGGIPGLRGVMKLARSIGLPKQ